MEVAQLMFQRTSYVYLSKEFLAPYYKKGDPFESLLARSTYLTKYCRSNETWTDTIRRVVEGNINQAPGVSVAEAEMLFHLFWTCQALPPGRGLWTGGVEGMPPDAKYNCWYTTLYGVDDWCWIANQLMLGGGVGVGLSSLDTLPVVNDHPCRFAVWCREDHPNLDEVKPEGPSFLNGVTPKYVCEDSREGWVTSLQKVLTSAFHGTDIVIDVSKVRERGSLIRTFGGIACGPGPLTQLLRAAWNIVRGAKGRRLASVEALDITNHIGLCIKAGNVRRSSLIVLGDPCDREFRDAKKDFDAVLSHRHTSNNSLTFTTKEQIDKFDWKSLVSDNIDFGEPGILNLYKGRKTDPGAMGVNPCFAASTLIAVADGRNVVTIEQLAKEGRDVPVYAVNKQTGDVEIKMGRNPRVTGHAKTLVRVWLDDGSYLDTTPEHKFILFDGTEVKASDLNPGDSLPRFTKSLEQVKKGGKDYYLVYNNARDLTQGRTFEHRLIAKFFHPDDWSNVYSNCVSNGFANTGGLVVHHKDYNQLNNTPDNLQIMSFQEHCILHNKDQFGEFNGRWSGFSSDEVREHALVLTKTLGRRFSVLDWSNYARCHGLPQRFSTFRRNDLGSVLDLAKWCAVELCMEYIDIDPRVVRTYKSMLEQGYDAKILNNIVLVTKNCETCGSIFDISHAQREQSFCSLKCSNVYINNSSTVKSKRCEGLDKHAESKMRDIRVNQARICSDLMFAMDRKPKRKEWSLACKKESVTSRIGPTLKFGYRQYADVLAAATDYNHKVSRIEVLEGAHTVYNITVDDFHTLAVVTKSASKKGNTWYKGVFVGNCGEVLLHDKEACNLAEVFPSKFEEGIDPVVVFRLVTRYCLRQRLVHLSDKKADEVQQKNMRLGVGLGGVCDFSWTPEFLAKSFGVCRKEADDYADELGVRRPIAVTTIKPSGTISLLSGSSPGMHAPHAPYYIRRIRIAKNDPMTVAMMKAKVPYEEDVYDSSGYTWVFSFPVKSDSYVTKETDTVRAQFERQVALQEWWSDNAVSATIGFNAKTERDEMAACLEEFIPRLKSTSMYPKSSKYAQAPYEAISETTYREMYRKIDHSSKLIQGGDMDLEECEGGICPIR